MAITFTSWLGLRSPQHETLGVACRGCRAAGPQGLPGCGYEVGSCLRLGVGGTALLCRLLKM
eukprot:3538639-Rhodomonas_salina.1